MKKTMKIIAILLVAIMAVMVLSNTAFASADIWDGIQMTQSVTSGAATKVGNMAGQILNITQVIGMAVAVVMLIVLAIKYISAAPSDKAEIKKHAVVYVVGAVVLFAATGILEIIKQFAKGLN